MKIIYKKVMIYDNFLHLKLLTKKDFFYILKLQTNVCKLLL